MLAWTFLPYKGWSHNRCKHRGKAQSELPLIHFLNRPKPSLRQPLSQPQKALFEMTCKVGKGFYVVPANLNASNSVIPDFYR